MNKRSLFIFVFWFGAAISAQDIAPVILQEKPTRTVEPFAISPGMLLSLHVRGPIINREATSVADGVDLPTELNGIQVTYQHNFTGRDEIPLPILRIDYASGIYRFGDYRIVTVYIPPPYLPPNATPLWEPVLRVWVDGKPGLQSEFRYTRGQPRVFSRCSLPIAPIGSESCEGPAITHEDGTFVTRSNPAKPGEIIYLWAIGIHLLQPPVYGTALAANLRPLQETVLETEPRQPHPTKIGVFLIPVRIPREFPDETLTCPPREFNFRMTIGTEDTGHYSAYLCVQKP
jgi:hypothetical protein